MNNTNQFMTQQPTMLIGTFNLKNLTMCHPVEFTAVKSFHKMYRDNYE